MRRLNVASKKQAIKVVTELDAFPKVLDDCQEKTASGGGSQYLQRSFNPFIIWYIIEPIYKLSVVINFNIYKLFSCNNYMMIL